MNRALVFCSLLLATSAMAAPAQITPTKETERERLLVMQWRLAPGLDPEGARVLESMLVTHLQSIGKHEVVSHADIVAMLGVEQEKQLMGCGNESCIAEIGGALGAGWMLTGSLGKLGEESVLTLKLLDVKQARLNNQLTETLPPQPKLQSEAIRVATYQLLRMDVPEAKNDNPWYTNPWIWTAAGVVAVGAGVGIYLATRPDTVPDSNLGRVTF